MDKIIFSNVYSTLWWNWIEISLIKLAACWNIWLLELNLVDWTQVIWQYENIYASLPFSEHSKVMHKKVQFWQSVSSFILHSGGFNKMDFKCSENWQKDKDNYSNCFSQAQRKILYFNIRIFRLTRSAESNAWQWQNLKMLQNQKAY